MMMLTCFIILSIGFAGCTSQAPPVSKTSTIEPSEMALQTSEYPANFTLVEKAERNSSTVADWGIAHGWKKGYYALYKTNDPVSPPGTVVEQYISVYPVENITLVIPDTKSGLKNWTIETDKVNLSIEELSSPGIGDSSSAMKIFDKSDNTEMYIISFIKKDVYQDFWTNGTARDFETIRSLAGIAAAKIK